ncbi:uncharacterized protein EI97DRAFT_387767 [Westerdykella ornata]|uniref:RanBP2-type domain-containing protein n=1 Tax=Westerdykella ornata TaxID=318751 RepID=A0A6A6J695_WESOR|nr:uncharacterized protein EI97DRAFT_387767 [Westerdykella ornata]KAF2271488.1 hypothetical protein EI97DRAFT_387767 [Westerdykella ornata]
MEIPRGHAMLPLKEADLLDFIYNYFKAEYAPIRSFWSTAAAEPRQPQRWVSMGHELTPLTFRPANAQAQKDLESLDYFIREKNLDAAFVRGLVVRFAKYEVHERLEKKLYESARLDLMVRKALKEKHVIDALWPSPAARDIPQELLKQGVQVRQWYGDMFVKYFRHLHSLDDFSLRPEVDAKIRSSGALMLVPFVDHLVFGTVDPIFPIVAKGAGYANSQAWQQKDSRGTFGEPEQFEIRFDAAGDIEETQTRSVVRQCHCLKCGAKRDVKVIISLDPSPSSAAAASRSSKQSTNRETTEARPPTPPSQRRPQIQDRPVSPLQKKQCPRCTFLNHPDLTTCEMCQGDLPETLVSDPPSPARTSTGKPSHARSESHPPSSTTDPQRSEMRETARPAAPNRHSLSSTLFSIFPFSQHAQTEHHARLPPSQPVAEPKAQPVSTKPDKDSVATASKQQRGSRDVDEVLPSSPEPGPSRPSTAESHPAEPSTPPLSQSPQFPALLPFSPPSPRSPDAPPPAGLPHTLVEYDFVPVSASPTFAGAGNEEEDAGWGEVSREEARRSAEDQRRDDAKDEGEDDEEGGKARGMIDLDAVAREEMGVWGIRDDE